MCYFLVPCIYISIHVQWYAENADESARLFFCAGALSLCRRLSTLLLCRGVDYYGVSTRVCRHRRER